MASMTSCAIPSKRIIFKDCADEAAECVSTSKSEWPDFMTQRSCEKSSLDGKTGERCTREYKKWSVMLGETLSGIAARSNSRSWCGVECSVAYFRSWTWKLGCVMML